MVDNVKLLGKEIESIDKILWKSLHHESDKEIQRFNGGWETIRYPSTPDCRLQVLHYVNNTLQLI